MLSKREREFLHLSLKDGGHKKSKYEHVLTWRIRRKIEGIYADHDLLMHAVREHII